MKIVIAPDSFKESLGSVEVAKAIQEGWQRSQPHAEYRLIPISDGGEGIIASFLQACEGDLCEVEIRHPLTTIAQTIKACYAWLPHMHTIVVEAAEALGLALIAPELRNPMYTSSFGLGEILLDIQKRFLVNGKADTVIIGIGGTASVDGGIGMAQALGVKFYGDDGSRDEHRQANTKIHRAMEVKGGGSLARVHAVDSTSLLWLKDLEQFRDIQIIVASDVQNPLLGERGAVRVFAPQKGADNAMVLELEEGMQHYATSIARDLALDLQRDINFSSAGAAGGLGMALAVFCKATIQSGISLMMEQLALEQEVQHADLVITGEGRVDGQSLEGKVVFGVSQLCAKHGVPVCVIAGALGEGYEAMYAHGATAMFSATAISTDWASIKENAYANIVELSRSISTMNALAPMPKAMQLLMQSTAQTTAQKPELAPSKETSTAERNKPIKQDKLFNFLAEKSSFSFDNTVAEVFDDMAVRSIPGYDMQQRVIAEYACKLINANNKNLADNSKTTNITASTNSADTAPQPSAILDLGCSTGQSIISISKLAQQQQLSLQKSIVIATDYSTAMLAQCKVKLASVAPLWQAIDIQQLNLSESKQFWQQVMQQYPQGVTLITMHFVLQFVPQSHRKAILHNAWNALQEGGALLIAEKIYSTDTLTQAIWQGMQYQFKKQTGYSDVQIESKNRALEGVLMPDEQDSLETVLTNLCKSTPNSTITLYYAHGEFRCYALCKSVV